MKFEGTVTINAPREKVWASLTDPAFVSQCAPGLEKMEIIEPDKTFRVVASIGLGSVKATFDANVEWLELNRPNFAQVKAHGSAQGSAVDVTSGMYLSDNPDNSTELKWDADVVIVGTIASLASRLMGGVTKKMTGAFFDCVKSKIETVSEVKA